jgi:4-amino-4-deoxy-L-arabinose transferase-like glycosyltransferase
MVFSSAMANFCPHFSRAVKRSMPVFGLYAPFAGAPWSAICIGYEAGISDNHPAGRRRVGNDLFRVHSPRRGWLAVLILSIVPAWFYHSRTAFETVIAVSFYTLFFWVISNTATEICAGYTRPLQGRLWHFTVTALPVWVWLFLPSLCDFRFKYHGTIEKTWKPLLFFVVITLPYFRYVYLHPVENQHHLELLRSYWLEMSAFWKIWLLFTTYVRD